MLGPSGSGKTSLLYALLDSSLQALRPARFLALLKESTKQEESLKASLGHLQANSALHIVKWTLYCPLQSKVQKELPRKRQSQISWARSRLDSSSSVDQRLNLIKEKPFNPTRRTSVASISKSENPNLREDDNRIKFICWDFCGRSAYTPIRESFYAMSALYLLVISLEQLRSKKDYQVHLDEWLYGIEVKLLLVSLNYS